MSTYAACICPGHPLRPWLVTYTAPGYVDTDTLWAPDIEAARAQAEEESRMPYRGRPYLMARAGRMQITVEPAAQRSLDMLAAQETVNPVFLQGCGAVPSQTEAAE